MILVLSISLILIMYGCSLLINYTGFIYKGLATLVAGTPRIIIYCIKQYYFDGKISIKGLRNIYIRSFILSHIRWLIYITCIPLLYPYVENLAFLTLTWFPNIFGFILYLLNCFNLNTILFCSISDISPPSLKMQLATITHEINFGFNRLQNISIDFDNQFNKAFLSRNPEDIALARHYRSQIATLRETLESKIKQREQMTARAYTLYRNPYLNYYAKTDPQHQSILDVTYTYVYVDKWDI